MGPRLSERSGSRDNVFDVLRLAAAMAVLLSHCYPLTGRDEPVARVAGETLGDLGVSVFFAISGFLVARSWASQPHLRPFAAKRALRLLPALIVCVWLLALVLGPLTTTLSPSSYFTTPQTWIYPLRSSVLITFAGRLPGVFQHNPFPAAVDGSLWTLPLEACCYVMVAVLGALALLHRRALLAAAVVIGLVALSPPVDIASHLPGGGENTVAGGNVQIVLHLVVIFLIGSLLFAARDVVRLSWWIAAAFAVVWVLAWKSSWVTVAASLFVPYADPRPRLPDPDRDQRPRPPGRRLLRRLRLCLPGAAERRARVEGRDPRRHAHDRGARHLCARPRLLATHRVAGPRAQGPRRRHVAAPGGALRGRGRRLVLPALMLTTTDRPLRLAFVGQSTFFEACALDSGTSPRFDTALPRVPRRRRHRPAALRRSRRRPGRGGRLSSRDHPRRRLRRPAGHDRRLPHRATAAHRRRRGTPATRTSSAGSGSSGEVDGSNFDRIVAFDPLIAATADRVLPVWRAIPLPVADRYYRPVTTPDSTAPAAVRRAVDRTPRGAPHRGQAPLRRAAPRVRRRRGPP